MRRTLRRLWVSLTETGRVILSAPASTAACAPFRLGTSAATVRPGIALAWRTSAPVSAMDGRTWAGTKEPTSISRTPAAASASIQAFLCFSDMSEATLCRPSRGPTSLTSTSTPSARGIQAPFSMSWYKSRSL